MLFKTLATYPSIFSTPKKGAPPQPSPHLAHDADEDDFLSSMLAQQTKLTSPYYNQYPTDFGTFRNTKKEYELTPKGKAFTSPQVGNSEDELSASDTEDDGAAKLSKFRLSSPITPKEVTIIGSDGVIKGDQVIFLAHQIVKEAIASALQKASYSSKKTNPTFLVEKNSDWLVSAGHWAKSQADLETKVSFNFEKAKVGPSHLKVHMTYPGRTERVHLSDDPFLKKLYKDKVPAATDFSCADISTITSALIKSAKLDEQTTAKIQLDRLKGDTSSTPEGSRIGPWLDFVNAWLFGVESSRINTTFVTGIMVLELVQAGKLTYKEALAESDFGGQLPPATLNSGPGNFAARKKLLEHASVEPTGLSEDRQHPQWLSISLKEALVIKNWLKFKGVISRDLPTAQLHQNIAKAISDLLTTYYGE